MKKIIFYITFLLICISCKNNDNSEITLYYYGRSPIGTTFEVPVRFYENGKEKAFFVFYSSDQNLESGVYEYNDTVYPPSFYWGIGFCYANKTFYKEVSKWESNYITGGNVNITRNGEQYTFLIDVTDNKGEKHIEKFEGKAKKESYHQQSIVKGEFSTADIENCMVETHFTSRLPADYSGGMTWLYLESGDVLNGKRINIIFLHSNANDFTGTYSVDANANGSYREGKDMIQNIVELYPKRSQYDPKLISGTFTISKVDKPWHFKIDVDVVDDLGDIIQGSFDGGQITFSDYDYARYGNWNNVPDYYYFPYVVE
ncbi:MAG: hypothetical protein LBN95_05935 [Prevotellaceae bacterium]|jgi:hypothetical protein|nr:hypothetical protein [Prevotellaceae bacterium]